MIHPEEPGVVPEQVTGITAVTDGDIPPGSLSVISNHVSQSEDFKKATLQENLNSYNISCALQNNDHGE